MPAIVAYTQAQLLALFERIFPVEYWQPIADLVGDGLEIYQAIAKVFSLTSQEVETFWKGSLLALAPAGAYASVTVELFRDTATAGAVIVKTGTVVTTSDTGRDFITQADVVFGALDLGPFEVLATALYPDDEFNEPGPATTAAGETVPGAIDTIKKLVMDPTLGDLTIQVRQVTDATGGSFPWLEQLGADRGMPRQAGEGEAIYRWRIQQLPQVVTPNAIQAFIDGVFATTGFPASSIEPNSMLYQTCYNGPSTSDGDYDATLFVYNDPRPASPFMNRWLTTMDAHRAFVVIVPLLPPASDTSLVFNDTAVSSAGLLTPLGQRALGAYSIPSGLLPPYGVQEACYNGFDKGKEAFYSSLYEQLKAISAGGVFVAIELEGE